MPGIKGQWTAEENYSLLFQMVQQLMGDGRSPVKYENINIPGRTPRALKEHYAQMKNEVQAADLQNQGGAGVPKVRAPRGPGSGKKVKTEGKGTAKAATPSKRKSNDDGNMMDTTPTNKRRKSPVKKQLVEEEPEAEDSEDMLVLHDSSGDDAASASPQSYHSYDYYN